MYFKRSAIMPTSKPEKKPPSDTGTSTAGQSGPSAGPTQSPPGQSTGAAAMGASRPRELSPEEQALTAGQGIGASAPSAMPPAQAAAGATVWQSDKRVSALYSINQNRNSWVLVQDIGWKKLANTSDSSVVALSILSASAKQTQTRYDYREEADGMIHEIYVW